MANICVYKIMVKGRKKACYALVNMMPLYTSEKELIREDGTEDDYTLVFSGDCKWSVDSYTSALKDPKPFTDEELDAVKDGDYWNVNLKDKSVLLDCEIFCNSKDIEDSCWAIFDHYNRGKSINDECPKELHIARGRDYDSGDDVVVSIGTTQHVIGRMCKVKFERGAYNYIGDFEVGDLVYVDGAMSGQLGRVTAISDNVAIIGLYPIKEKVGHADMFVESDVEAIWTAYKPKERKTYLERLGLDTTIAKKKFISLMDWRWTNFALANNNWKEFLDSIR